MNALAGNTFLYYVTQHIQEGWVGGEALFWGFFKFFCVSFSDSFSPLQLDVLLSGKSVSEIS